MNIQQIHDRYKGYFGVR